MSVRTDLQSSEPPPTLWGVWYPFDENFTSEIDELTQTSHPLRLVDQIAAIRDLANNAQVEVNAGVQKEIWQQLEREIGIKLFNAIVQSRIVQKKFWKAYQEAKPFRMEINATDYVTSGLPWEFLRANENQLPFALSPDTPVIRRAGVFNQHWTINKTVKIQVVSASPTGIAPPNVDQEFFTIKQTLGEMERAGRCLIPPPIRDASIGKLGDILSSEKPHVLHLVTHGEPGSIILENEVSRKPRSVSGIELASIIKKHHPGISMIIATACESAALPQTGDSYSVIHELSQNEIPVVIGMQFEISEETAEIFTAHMYHNLSLSNDIETSITTARQNIYDLRRLSGEWAAPVLYLSTSEPAILFQKTYVLALRGMPENAEIIKKIHSNIELSFPHPNVQDLEELGKILVNLSCYLEMEVQEGLC